MREILWTSHAKYKMNYYRLSESRVKRVMSSPLRREVGIAEGTVAMMQKAGTEKHPYEIWVMVAELNSKNSKLRIRDSSMRVISAWRYPGITRPGEPLPQAILNEMREIK